ncbi:FxsB family cyclophane-forming radical SAM/SPASM peptide maturase [Streptomyces phyllanthi]|uniref:FxsB family radical SAM/SPASM domain protein n=1 Tax=Streptomyces phyllanthi TaxID=1803180 RepID=A0A5N8VZ52_9ACTN|nr:FxsB family cyclophane-forming radical SAM/SPASM peptide maturase [Streptomyces phyllanthi]MPY39215.1 FxsB family radical SAM/SPASM domain protein [Streptomyces phyllanthi]
MTVRPRAFRQFVLKMHSRCDLACDHCYVYQHADQSWQRRPPVMPDDVAAATVARIAEHARGHPELTRVHVVLHGGEPLLAGRERLARITSGLRRALDGVCDLDVRMQTNGLRLDGDFCDMLAREGIRTGISLDGDRVSHDRHRRRANGTGSYDAVVRAVRLIGSPAYRRMFAGLLCTVDVENDPVDVYRALGALDPPRVDFLLPHATWDRPPPQADVRPHAYARWLTAVYDQWTAEGRPFAVRLFDSIEAVRDGRGSLTEALGLSSPDLVVVETDGEIEQADWLKTAGQDAPRTGFHVLRHSFDEAAGHPGFLVRQTGVAGLSRTCRECRVVRLCGGGLYAHRYRSDNGFDNPSVYCGDLIRLIDHCRDDARRQPVRPAHTLTSHGFDSLAAGNGDADVLRDLVGAESSIRRVLLAALCARYRGPEAEAVTRMDQRWPGETAEVLRHPYLRHWSVRALEGQLARDAVRQRLAEIAVAVALRTGADLTVGLRGTVRAVHVPGYGRLVLPPRPGKGELVVRRGALLLRVHDRSLPIAVTESSHDGPSWEPVRSIVMDGFRILVEDGDPHRDAFGGTPAPRLDDEEYVRWQRLFAEAAVHVQGRHGGRAAGVRTLLTVCTPLSQVKEQGVVAAAPDAFGALGLSLPATPDRLAALLVDGVQQMKFNALSDLFDLAGNHEAKDRLRSAYLGRTPPGALPTEDLTDHGRRMAARLRG